MIDIVHIVILILHVLGAAILIGVSFVSLIIQIKPPMTQDYLKILGTIWKIAGPITGLQILTGLYLALSEWDKFGSNPLFWIKMLLVFVIGLSIAIVSSKKLNAINKSGSDNIHLDTKLAWIGLINFAVIASIGVIILEMAG